MQRVNLPIGTSDFTEIRREGWYYVDKTGLIGDLLNTRKAKVTLITRPRRFGKTLGMNMLANFFDIRKDSEALFEGLEVSKDTTLCLVPACGRAEFSERLRDVEGDDL